MTSLPSARYWIDGEWVAAQTKVESINFATGEIIGAFIAVG